MKENIKKIIIGVIIGIFALPTLTMGGSFTVSLIQGKSVEEAIQILAEQIDILIGRIEVVETKQIELEAELTKQKTEQAKQEAYNAFRRAYDKIWLYGKTEEESIEDTMKACDVARKEGNEGRINAWCPLAQELETTWNAYQEFLLEPHYFYLEE